MEPKLRIAQARKVVDRKPTEARKLAGNYRMGHAQVHGLRVTIETPKGGVRSGKAADGKVWKVRMPCDYGYFKGTKGRDGDGVDVMVGAHPMSELVVVVDQVDPKSGRFDEHKVVLGCRSAAEAKALYLACYEEGWKGLGATRTLTMPQFKRWLKSGNKRKAIASQKLTIFENFMKPVFFEMTEKEREQLRRDRRAVAMGAGVSALAGLAALRYGRKRWKENAALNAKEAVKTSKALAERVALGKAAKMALDGQKVRALPMASDAVKAQAERVTLGKAAKKALDGEKVRALPMASDALQAQVERARWRYQDDLRQVAGKQRRVAGKLEKNAARNVAKAPALLPKRYTTMRERTRVDFPDEVVPVDAAGWRRAPEAAKASVAAAERASGRVLSPGEREAAKGFVKKLKERHNFMKKLKVRFFAKKDRKGKNDRERMALARDAALAGAGVAGIGAAGYVGYQGKKAVDGLAKRGRVQMRRVDQMTRSAGRTVKDIGESVNTHLKPGLAGFSETADNLRNATRVTADVGRAWGALRDPFVAGMKDTRSVPARTGAEKLGRKIGKMLGKSFYGKMPVKKLMARMGKVHLFGGSQLRDKKDNVFANPWKVSAGLQQAYVPDGKGGKVDVDLPVLHGQTIRSTMNMARDVNRTGGRVGRLGKDVVAVVRGKPRERDASGRIKQREWEKAWFRNAAGAAVTSAGLLAGANHLRKNPLHREWLRKKVNRGMDAVNEVVPDVFPKRFAAKDRVTTFASGNARILGQREKVLATLRSRARFGGEGGMKAAKVAKSVQADVVARRKLVKAAGRKSAATLKAAAEKAAARKASLKKMGVSAGAGAVAGAALMKGHAEMKESGKRDVAGRLRNTLVGAVAGGGLGGMVIPGGASGLRGYRVGAALGAGLGALSNPQRKAYIENLPYATFSDEDYARRIENLGLAHGKFWKPKKKAEKAKRRFIERSMAEWADARDGVTELASKQERQRQQNVKDGIALGGTLAGTVAGGALGWHRGTKAGFEDIDRMNAMRKRIHGSLREMAGHYGVKSKPLREIHVNSKAGQRMMKRAKQAGMLGGGVLGTAAGMAAGGMGAAVADHVMRKRQKKEKVQLFDAAAEDAGWDIRDPRGRSARVFAPGSRSRDRREKKWHERLENERLLWKMGMGTAALAGLGVGAYGKKMVGGKGLKEAKLRMPVKG